MSGYTLYGDLDTRETIALSTTLFAKGLAVEFVSMTPSLSLSLAARAGCEVGPYLRTPEGFVLSDLHAMLDWIERTHPKPPMMPTTPVRRTCARLLEDWIECWLPIWPRRSWSTLEALGVHLEATGFMLGESPGRVDALLAAWLEADVLVHDHARAHLAQQAPRLALLGGALLDAPPRDAEDDVIPISLLPVLGEIAEDYHAYLVGNHEAIKDASDRVMLDLGLGRRALPTRRVCETRRLAIARELALFAPSARLDVRRILEPVGAWHVLTLPAVLAEVDASDPRSL